MSRNQRRKTRHTDANIEQNKTITKAAEEGREQENEQGEKQNDESS